MFIHLARAPIDSGYPELTVVAEQGVVTADGLAVDWVYNHVYWTDTGEEQRNIYYPRKKTFDFSKLSNSFVTWNSSSEY